MKLHVKLHVIQTLDCQLSTTIIHSSPKETQVLEGCISFWKECISVNLTSCRSTLEIIWQNWNNPGSLTLMQGHVYVNDTWCQVHWYTLFPKRNATSQNMHFFWWRVYIMKGWNFFQALSSIRLFKINCMFWVISLVPFLKVLQENTQCIEYLIPFFNLGMEKTQIPKIYLPPKNMKMCHIFSICPKNGGKALCDFLVCVFFFLARLYILEFSLTQNIQSFLKGLMVKDITWLSADVCYL